MEVIFYTIHCAQCRGLEMQLKAKKIDYTECTDVEEMIKAGLQSAPGLKVDGVVMTYHEALSWLKGLNK